VLVAAYPSLPKVQTRLNNSNAETFIRSDSSTWRSLVNLGLDLAFWMLMSERDHLPSPVRLQDTKFVIIIPNHNISVVRLPSPEIE
jgi:hypothetical protein